ncbi:MAG: hypothetical protein JW950_03135 [Deltaproteobacteria bacterium]|nr:hypothetical protein [Deltaproteobacteria bacterium]
MNHLRIKAGKLAYDMIMDGGFNLDAVSAFFAPAAGPRWLVASGFDLTMMERRVLGRKRPVLLVGASAGAWRFAAWMQPEPRKSYHALMDAYIGMIYRRTDTPKTVLQSLIDIINAYLEDDALPFALENKRYRLAVITARSRNLVGSERHLIQQIGLGLCYLLNIFDRSFIFHFAERIVFYNGPKPPAFCLAEDFQGRFVPLSEVNFKSTVLASGAIPLVVAGVQNIYEAPYGVYRDGGLTDYHLTLNYAPRDGELTLFFHHQERIIPGWLDKRLTRRRPPEAILDNVLMVFPSEDFVAKLPCNKVPDRDDFKIYIDDPATRIRNWQKAVELSAPLGEQFLDLLENGGIRDVLERL